MQALRRVAARACGKLPGISGLVGYVVCCVLPCRACLRVCGNGGKGRRADERSKMMDHHADVVAHLTPGGERQVLLLGLDGAGKSAFLWMCEHPEEAHLPASLEVLAATKGVARIMRKAVPSLASGLSLDLDLVEIGGGAVLRPFWPHYLTPKVNALVFFVDASAPERILEAAEQFAIICRAASQTAPRARLAVVATHAALPDTTGAASSDAVHGALMATLPSAIPPDRVSSVRRLPDLPELGAAADSVGDTTNAATARKAVDDLLQAFADLVANA